MNVKAYFSQMILETDALSPNSYGTRKIPRSMYMFHGHRCWVQPLSIADFHVYLCPGHGDFPLIWDSKSFWVAYEVKVMFCNIYANTNVLDASLRISYFEPPLPLYEKKIYGFWEWIITNKKRVFCKECFTKIIFFFIYFLYYFPILQR